MSYFVADSLTNRAAITVGKSPDAGSRAGSNNGLECQKVSCRSPAGNAPISLSGLHEAQEKSPGHSECQSCRFARLRCASIAGFLSGRDLNSASALQTLIAWAGDREEGGEMSNPNSVRHRRFRQSSSARLVADCNSGISTNIARTRGHSPAG